MDVRKMRNELLGKRLVAALESRNMEAYYVETKEEAVKKALELIPKGSSINMGGATSVKECGLYEALSNGEYQFYDRDKVSTQEEKQEIALKAFTSDYFLGSVNAMSEDGVFINIDGNANRVAAYAYGPKHVLLIVGMNKVVKTEADAMSRARNEAAPINAQRFGIDTPCSKNGTCFDCKSPQCICCQILTTRFSKVKGRFQIILVRNILTSLSDSQTDNAFPNSIIPRCLEAVCCLFLFVYSIFSEVIPYQTLHFGNGVLRGVRSGMGFHNISCVPNFIFTHHLRCI